MFIKKTNLNADRHFQIFSCRSNSRIANVHPSVSLSSIAQNAYCLSKSCLLIIMPIDRKAYELSDFLLQLLSLLVCYLPDVISYVYCIFRVLVFNGMKQINMFMGIVPRKCHKPYIQKQTKQVKRKSNSANQIQVEYSI